MNELFLLRSLPRSLKTRAVLCVFVSLVFVVACDSSEPLTSSTPVAAAQTLPVVTRVIDGDTIVVEGTGTVRLIGVDTPETVDPRQPVQYFGREASDFTKELATGKRVGWSSIKTARTATAERWPTAI